MTIGKFTNMDGDHVPIISSIKRFGIGLREIVVLVLLILLAVICIVLAALLSVEKAKWKNQVPGPSANAQTGNHRLCLSPPCLRISVHALENMNTTLDPCDDFYKYACGNFKRTHKPDPVDILHSTLTDLEKENERKVEILMLKPINRYTEPSSERKMKELYQSCMDEFTKEKLKGKPAIEKIIPKMNGWYVFGTWTEKNFDLNQALKTVQTDFFTDALYSLHPGYDIDNLPNRIIEIHPGGISYNMPYFSYLDFSGAQEQADYKTFVRRIAELLLRDANIATTPDVTKRIKQFADDVYHMESMIVKTHFGIFPDEDMNYIFTIDELTKETSPIIDWTFQISSIFYKLGVTKDTKIFVNSLEYLTTMTQYISNLNSTEMPRIMHNYLIWRIIERVLPELSSEYDFASKEIFIDLNGHVEFQPRSTFCLQGTSDTFPDVMGALFVADHFFEKNINHVTDIASELRETLLQSIPDNTWMDSQTKTTVIDKVKAISFVLGYPPYITDHHTLDEKYKEFSINISDYFQNVLNIFQYERLLCNEDMMTSTDPTKWNLYFKVYSTEGSYFHYLNQVILPAGLLQFPVYDYNIPHYMTFGAIGSLMGRSVIFSIGDQGRMYKKTGEFIQDSDTGIWSTASATAFNESVLACITNSTHNIMQGPFSLPDMSSESIPLGRQIIGAIIDNAAGVRLSYKAYQNWKNLGKVKEMQPLTTNLKDEQMFFVSYAQTFCETYNDEGGYDMAITHGVKNIRINLELQQLDEFSQAFKCSAGSNMNPAKKCPLY